ncbi:hypothetical protein RYX36_035970 [Vicia faba]
MLPRENPGSCSTQLLNVKQEPHEQRGPNLPSTPVDLSFHIGLIGAESVRNIPASSRVEAGDHSLESSEVRPPLKPQPSGTIKAKSEDNHEKLGGCSTSNVADNARAINGNVSCGPNNYRQKGPRIAKVVRRINCNFEPLEFGIVFSGKSGAEFRREMQRHSVAIRQLLHYKGQPDPLKGDDKAVRDTANEGHSLMKNETGSGSYKSPNLQRSPTFESEHGDIYEPVAYRSETQNSFGISKNQSSGSWNQDSRVTKMEISNGESRENSSENKTREDRLVETIPQLLWILAASVTESLSSSIRFNLQLSHKFLQLHHYKISETASA